MPHSASQTLHPVFLILQQNIAAMLRRQERDRKWRANYKSMERKLVILEEDEYQLERIYPQVGAGD